MTGVGDGRESAGRVFGFALLLLLGCSNGAAPGGTCQSLRLCAFDCADDACVQACRAKGAASALAAFDTLEACTVKACPKKGDVTCACGEQCLADGACLAAVDACLGDVSDAICDNLCH
jgi:hypothetical protein